MFTQDNFSVNKVEFIQGNKFTAKPIKLDFSSLENKSYRIDLELYGVRHNDSSYEGRVFVNNSDANIDTPKDIKHGYIDSFYVFGHGGICYGDKGHCEVPEYKNYYDLRRSHPLTPLYLQVDITKAVNYLKDKSESLVVTIVPVVKKDEVKMQNLEKILEFEKLSIITYDWPGTK